MRSGTILDRSGNRYKPATVRSYERSIRLAIVPALGSRRVSDVRRVHVQAFVDEQRASGIAASTVHNRLDPLRVVFRRALRAEEIGVDPALHLDLPAIRNRRERIEGRERAHELIQALSDDDRALWTVLFYAGLRRGEARALRWTAVDFDEGVLRVVKTWDDEEGEVDPKSEAGKRAVPMGDAVRKALAAHKLRTGRDGADLVFGRTRTLPFIPSTVRTRARDAWAAVGLEPLSPHEARHCAVSYFRAAGYDWKEIQVWVGHSDVGTTMNVYAKLLPGSHREAAAKLDAFLAGREATAGG
jgi:integrase